MIKAFFLDFYGTVVHEDGEIIKKITQIIYDTGEVENMSEIDAFWWNDFQNMFTNSYGDCFETQRELEKKSLKHTLIKFGSIADVDRLSNYMFEHWVKPPIFEDSLKLYCFKYRHCGYFESNRVSWIDSDRCIYIRGC